MSKKAEIHTDSYRLYGSITVSSQEPVDSLFDGRMDALLERAEYLLTHGVFHIKLHFGGEQMTCWWFNDPLRYQVYRGEEVFSEALLDKCSDSEILGLEIREVQVTDILQVFKCLRRKRGEARLRSASLNRVNGMLGFSFSCDNIQYLPHHDLHAFLHAAPFQVQGVPGADSENRLAETQSC